jgi:L-fucose isomerase-like protein
MDRSTPYRPGGPDRDDAGVVSASAARPSLRSGAPAAPGRTVNGAATRPAPFTLVAVASRMHDPIAVREALTGYDAALLGIGGTMVLHHTGAAGPLVVFAVTGGTEADICELAGLHAGPIVLVAHPGQNSLPAALEAAARLRMDGRRVRLVPLAGPGDRHGLALLRRTADDARCWHRLHAARIGCLGAASEWLVASAPATPGVSATWGPEFVGVDLARLIVATRRADPIRSVALTERVLAASDGMTGVVEADVQQAAGFHQVVLDTVRTQQLDAVTVRCFDLVTELGTSGCLALSELNDTGIVAGCEGDIASVTAMLWIDRLLGLATWMANPAWIDAGRGVVSLAHCTVPRSLVDGFELRSHFESGLGVAVTGRLTPGPVTLVRLGGRRLEELWVADADAVPTVARPARCRTQLDVVVGPAAAGELLDRPLGNHLVLVHGHHATRMRDWHDWLIA